MGMSRWKNVSLGDKTMRETPLLDVHKATNHAKLEKWLS
jgi:hypothetical protein